jgi:uncharacterized membrane protein YqjE
VSVGPPDSPASGGLLGALRAMGATLGEAARIRSTLLGVEFREEVERRKHMLLLAALAAAFLQMALLLLAILVAVAFWDTHRVEAIGIMTALYLAFGAAALVRLRTAVARSPAPFAATLGELDKDLAVLRSAR